MFNVQYIKGVGPSNAKKLKRLDIISIEDLLYYFPKDYEDRTNLKKIKYLLPGEKYLIKGKVLKIRSEKIRRGLNLVKVTFSDDTDVLNGIWFNQLYLKNYFKKDNYYFLYGELSKDSWYKYKSKDMNNPIFEEINDKKIYIHTGRIVPLYNLSSGLSQKKLRQIIYNAISKYINDFTEFVPEYIRKNYNFMNLSNSIQELHFPLDRKKFIRAKKRIVFEEFFILQLSLLKRKNAYLQELGIKHKNANNHIKEFIAGLSFELTSAQKRVWSEISTDMEKEIAMQRLLQGDVGSGKTVIAVMALIKTVSNGFQGVFMAPTEILAEQHYQKIIKYISPSKYKTALLVGSLSRKERNNILNKIKIGKYDIIVGTHALFQEDVEYNKLGLIIIDEQHRFGVEQRHKLKEKGNNPDLLVMTATPIPRSLAITLYGDLDLSLIDEIPPGRSKVITKWRTKDKRSQIYNFVEEKIREGRQVFVVCPLIEPSDELNLMSATKMKEVLEKKYFKKYNVALLHSKLASDTKKNIMNRFKSGFIDVLVSTTVIEVGVDIPNASIMIIENAERFGLAQLHQLRGRIGRGEYNSYCILISDSLSDEAKKRMKIITKINDGFEISEQDLVLRGPGEFFGKKQHGLPKFSLANIFKDISILKLARKEAESIINDINWEKNYPNLKSKIDEIDIKL